jgi:hypothetical protein
METGYSSARDRVVAPSTNLPGGLFKYPTPPPQQYMNISWISQEYDHLVKETMKANEKLLPLLMKRKFDGTTNTSPKPTASFDLGEKPEIQSARHEQRRQQVIDSIQ